MRHKKTTTAKTQTQSAPLVPPAPGKKKRKGSPWAPLKRKLEGQEAALRNAKLFLQALIDEKPVPTFFEMPVEDLTPETVEFHQLCKVVADLCVTKIPKSTPHDGIGLKIAPAPSPTDLEVLESALAYAAEDIAVLTRENELLTAGRKEMLLELIHATKPNSIHIFNRLLSRAKASV